MKQRINDNLKADILFSLTDAFLLAKKEIINEIDKITLESQKMPSKIEIDKNKLSKNIYRVWHRALREGLYGEKSISK